jgi:hypothetical protein
LFVPEEVVDTSMQKMSLLRMEKMFKVCAHNFRLPHEKVRHGQLPNEAATFNHFLWHTKVLHEAGASTSWDVDEEEMTFDRHFFVLGRLD